MEEKQNQDHAGRKTYKSLWVNITILSTQFRSRSAYPSPRIQKRRSYGGHDRKHPGEFGCFAGVVVNSLLLFCADDTVRVGCGGGGGGSTF